MLRFLSSLAAILVLAVICELVTTQFILYDIRCHKTSVPEWDTLQPENEELNVLKERFSQHFFYFGSGKNHHAYLSRDGKTLLKFFKQNNWDINWPVKTRRKLDRAFASCKLAYEKLKIETGMLCLHLNKTEQMYGNVALEDNLGFSHNVDLDAVQFAAQEYAKPMFSKIDREVKNGNLTHMERGICASLDCIGSIYQKGISLSVPPKRKNFAFIDDHAIVFDIDCFVIKNSPSQKELRTTTKYFRRWIKKYHPDIYLFYNKELDKRFNNI